MRLIWLSLTLLFPPVSLANDVDTLLRFERPAGVVFEIVSGDKAALDELLPELKRDIERLREKFPDLPVAVVSHGREQFALTSSGRSSHGAMHALTRSLVEEADVDVHVCGTHASWYDVTPEDFPDYVDVSASGPAQINDYEDLGYDLIVLP